MRYITLVIILILSIAFSSAQEEIDTGEIEDIPVCGDGKCSDIETADLCPKDCKTEETTEETIEDIETETSKESQQEQRLNLKLIIIPIAIILAIIIGIYLLYKRSTSQPKTIQNEGSNIPQ